MKSRLLASLLLLQPKLPLTQFDGHPLPEPRAYPGCNKPINAKKTKRPTWKRHKKKP